MYDQGASILLLNDCSHRVWNDYQASIRQCGLWGVVCLMTVVLNADGGPWSESRWWQVSKEAVLSYTAKTTHVSCAAWQYMWELVCLDMEKTHLVTDEKFQEETFKELPRVFEHKCQRVAMSRWFGWCDSSLRYLGEWHRRLAIML